MQNKNTKNVDNINEDMIKDMENEEICEESPLEGISFCLTGLMSMPRSTLQEGIEMLGGTVSSKVRKGLTYLVQADPNSNTVKTKDAQKFGVKIISEIDLLDMLEI